MRILPAFEEEIRRFIRDQRAKDPIISVARLKAALEAHFERGFSHKYVSKLADKVHKEALVQANRTKLDERLNITREKVRIASERLMQIIDWKPPEPLEDETLPEYLKRIRPPKTEDVIEAAKTFAMLEHALLKVELDCGLYKDATTGPPIERTLAIIPDTHRENVMAAFSRWGERHDRRREARV
jgi:hypothetical protein